MTSINPRIIWSSALAVFLLIAVILVSPFGSDSQDPSYRSEIHKKTFTAARPNIWGALSEKDAREVYDFVVESLPKLNLTSNEDERRDNFIFTVEKLYPNKTDAVDYIYDDGQKPADWAKVSIAEQFDNGPHMVFYMVGPLPISNESKILPLRYPFTSGKNYVKNPVHDYFALAGFTQKLALNLSDLTHELLGAQLNVANPNDPDSLLSIPRVTAVDEGGLRLWIQFFRLGLGSNAATLLPQGLYVKIDARSNITDEWSFDQVFYNGVLYENANALRAAVKDSHFVRAPRNIDGAWTATEDFESDPEGRELPPPIAIQPYGRRYRFDKKQGFVSWFGFEFYITTAPTHGITLFDIRFKGERVMYEVGLQEAMSHYAGNDPMQGGLEFMDAFFGMGKKMFELVPGYDCPAYSDYLDSSWNQGHQFFNVPNTVCIFEHTADHLLSRHSAQFSVTASRNTYLVVRAVSTVGNYDYTFDYIFYMDGTLEVKMRASGFIFSAFLTNNSTKEEDEFGHRIHDALSSSMHDHVINFKADLDVAGSENDMVRMAIEPLTRSFPWDAPEIKERNSMHLVETAVAEETGLEWAKNGKEFYIVYNAEKKNAWGERRGYRITPGTGMGNPIHLTIENSTVLGDAARWAEKDLWVVRRKDTEPHSADPLNWFAPHEPIVNFTRIADRESLERSTEYDGDLVVYFNLGGHHVPHSGDLPNTLMHTSASSVMFVPHNFLDRDPSRASVQGVRLQLKGDISGGFAGDEIDTDLRVKEKKQKRSKEEGGEDEHHAKYFGATYDGALKVPLENLEPNLIESYQSAELDVTDLGLNGTAAGLWFRGA